MSALSIEHSQSCNFCCQSSSLIRSDWPIHLTKILGVSAKDDELPGKSANMQNIPTLQPANLWIVLFVSAFNVLTFCSSCNSCFFLNRWAKRSNVRSCTHEHSIFVSPRVLQNAGIYAHPLKTLVQKTVLDLPSGDQSVWQGTNRA